MSVWGHTVEAAEVKKVNEIDAVIGHVAPEGVAAVGSTDSGLGTTDRGLTQATWSQGDLETYEDLESLASDLRATATTTNINNSNNIHCHIYLHLTVVFISD